MSGHKENSSVRAHFLPCIGHTADVNSVAFSPDGQRLASGSRDGTVWVWNADTAQPLGRLADCENPVLSAAFSPDGHWLAWSSGAQVTIWDIRTGRRRNTLEQEHPAWTLAFSPDGRLLATGNTGWTVQFWDTHSGRLLKTMAGHRSWVNSVTFSPDGQWLASGSGGHRSFSAGNQSVKLWAVHTGRELRTFAEFKDPVTTVAFSTDGRMLAAGGGDRVKLWDFHTGDLRHVLPGELSVRGVAFSPDGRRLVVGNDDRTVKLWDTATGQEVAHLAGHRDRVLCVAYSPDGRRIASGGNGNSEWGLCTTFALEGGVSETSNVPPGDDDNLKIWNLNNLD